MKIAFTGEITEITAGIALLEKDMGFVSEPGGKTVQVSRTGQGFRVCICGDTAEISYHKLPDFFRALAIALEGLRHGRTVRVEQKPVFDSLGIMLDVSRGAVLKVEKVKEMMRRIARMGFNQLMLYTEDVYEMKKYPYFGYFRGRYSQEELKEIVSYGNQLGIETVPCIQTLGHLAMPLRWAEFDEIKEQPAILFIGEEKTYELIEEMIKTVRSCFTTSKIHIGMDEAHGVGLGKYLNKHGYTDRFALLLEHLKRVAEICKKYDFAPMMWSDMFFRLGTPSGDYYDMNAELPEHISDFIPEGISQVYWDYYNHSEKLYQVMLREHKKMKRPIIFAGGVWTWSAPSVNYRQTFLSTLPALSECRRQEVRQVIATLWGDDGSECDVFQALYGLQLFAEYNYSGKVTEEELTKMFEICNGCSAETFRLLDVDNFDAEIYDDSSYRFADMESHIINTSKQVLYQNPLLGLFDKNFEGLSLRTHYEEISIKLEEANIPEAFEMMFACHKQLVKVLMDKCDVGIRLKAAYDAGDREMLSVLAQDIDALADEIAKLRKLRAALWYSNNKPFGYEKLNNRLAGAEAAVRLANERVFSYLNGETERLEELEQERLYYNSVTRPFFIEYFSQHIMMP